MSLLADTGHIDAEVTAVLLAETARAIEVALPAFPPLPEGGRIQEAASPG